MTRMNFTRRASRLALVVVALLMALALRWHLARGLPDARATSLLSPLQQMAAVAGIAVYDGLACNEPLVDRLVALLKAGQVLHADETPVQQLDPGQGKTRRAYLWAYRSNELEGAAPIVVFDYQTSRSGQMWAMCSAARPRPTSGSQ